MADQEQLYSSFANLEKLEKQKTTILGFFTEVKNGVLELSKLGITIDSAKSSKELADATKNLTKLQGELAAANRRVAESEAELQRMKDKSAQATKTSVDSNKAETSSYDKLSSSIGDNIKRRQELQSKLKDVRGDIKKLSEFEDAAKGSKQFTDEMVRLGAEEARLKLEIEQSTRFIKNQTREFLAAEGSLDELRAKLNQMLQAYDAMSDADKQTDFGKGALKSIKGLTDEIKKQEFETKRFQRNVGNYNESAKIIINAFDELKEKLASVNGDFSKFGPQGENLRKEFDALQRITEDPRFLNVAAKLGDATMETRYMIKALQSLEMQGLKDTDMFDRLQAHIAELTDSMEDTRQEVRALASDTREFDLFASAVGSLSSVFQTAASGTELLVGDNENLQKSMQKLMAIQNVSNGIRQIATDLTTRGTAANKAYAFVQGLVATATNASATATARLNAILKLSTIGLVITALGFLADKMGLFGGETSKAEKELDKFNSQLERSNVAIQRNIEKIERQIQLNIELAKQRGKTESEVSQITIDGIIQQQQEYQKLADQRNGDLKDFLKEAGKLSKFSAAYGFSLDLSEFEELETNGIPTIEKAEEILNRVADFKLTKVFEGFSKEGKAQVDLFESHVKSVLSALDSVDKKGFEAELKRQQDATREASERERKEKELAEKRRKAIEDEKKARLELIKFRLGLEAQYQEGLKNIEGSGEPENVAIKRRTDAAKLEYALRKQILEEQQKFDLSQEGATASQKKLIRERTADEIRELEQQLSLDIINIRAQEVGKLKQFAKEEADAFRDLQSNAATEQADSARSEFEKYEIALEGFAVAEKQALNKRFEDGKITREQYNIELAKIDMDAQRVRLENEIKFWEKILEIMRAAGNDTSEAEKAIQRAKNELSNLTVNSKQEEAIAKQIELIDQLKEKYKELGTSIRDAFTSLAEGLFESQKQDSQEAIEKIEEEKNAQIARVNAEAEAEEKKAAKIKAIEAKAEADKAAQQRRQQQLDRNKAIFERVFKGFQISTDTIQSVAKIKASVAELTARSFLNPFLVPLIPLAAAQIPITIATGAASLAALFATPIPKYAKGTTGAPRKEWAIVAEEGRELVKETSGKTTLHEKPTFLYMQPGTKVIPNKATEKELRKSNSFKYAVPTTRAKYVPSVAPVKVVKMAAETKAVKSDSLADLARAHTNSIAYKKMAQDILAAHEADRKVIVRPIEKQPVIQFPEDRTGEVVAQLKKLNNKPPTVILTHPSVETTPWYYQHLKN